MSAAAAILLSSLSAGGSGSFAAALVPGARSVFASSIGRRWASSVPAGSCRRKFSIGRSSRPTRRTPLAVASLPMTASLSGEAGSNIQPNNDGTTLRPLVVCGPSGAGKGTIIGRYLSDPSHRGSDRFGFAVSHTTRSPRPGEEDGVHYHFTDRDAMRAAIDAGEFLEYAEVHGNLYGTSYESLRAVQDDLGRIALLDIDVQGVRSVKAAQERDDGPPLRPSFVFIAPPSLEELRERLAGRGTETAESLERRTENAAAEMEYGLAPGNFDAIVVNHDLDRACDEFAKVVGNLYDFK